MIVDEFDEIFWSDRIERNYFFGDSIVIHAPGSSITANTLKRKFPRVSTLDQLVDLNDRGAVQSFGFAYVETVDADAQSLRLILERVSKSLRLDGRIWIRCSLDTWFAALFSNPEILEAQRDRASEAPARAEKFFEDLGFWNLSFGPVGCVFGAWISAKFPSQIPEEIEIHAYKAPSVAAKMWRHFKQNIAVASFAPVLVSENPDRYVRRQDFESFDRLYISSPPDEVITNFSINLFPPLLMTLVEWRARRERNLLDRLVRRLCDGAETSEERMLRIYGFVQSAILRDVVAQPLSLNGSIPTAEAILLSGVGRCGHVSRLLIAMLDRAGIRAKIWQLPQHVSVKASLAANDWFILDADVFKFGTVPYLDGRPISSERLEQDPGVLDTIPATGWFYDDVIGAQQKRPRGYTEMLSSEQRGFVSNYFDAAGERANSVPPPFIASISSSRLAPRTWAVTWPDVGAVRPDFVGYRVRVSSKSRFWSYSSFRKSRVSPFASAGDLMNFVTQKFNASIELPETVSEVYVEVVVVTRATADRPEIYAWPSEELRLKI